MTAAGHIDRWLWPYLRRRSVYVGLLFAYFVGIASSALMPPRLAVIEDLSVMVVALVVISSRTRYVVWWESVRRRHWS